jgi:hypothetical protein
MNRGTPAPAASSRRAKIAASGAPLRRQPGRDGGRRRAGGGDRPAGSRRRQHAPDEDRALLTNAERRLLWQQLSDQLDAPRAKLPSRHTWENIAGSPERAIEVIRQEIASLPRLMIVHDRSADRVLVEQILSAKGVTNPIVLRERFKVG